MTDKIKKYVLPNIPYVAFWIAFWKIHAMYRLLPYPDWLVGLAGAVLLRIIVYFKIKKAKNLERMWNMGPPAGGSKKT